MNIILAILFSILPVMILLILIYNMEDVKKQPFWLLTVLFICGILSWVLVKYISNLFGTDIYRSQIEVSEMIGNIGFFLVSFGVIATVEELSKFLIINLFCIKNKFFTNPYDGIMYAACISLGFAFIENIMYIQNYGMGVAISRAIFSIPVHAVFGIIMGYFLGLGHMCKNKDMTNDVIKYFYMAVFVPFLCHGAYDYLCNLTFKYNNIVFLVFVLFLYAIAVFLIIRLHRVDMKRINSRKVVLEEKRVYNPEKKQYKNIYYGINEKKDEVTDNNFQQANWKHTENDDVVYDENVVNMNMFKNNSDN